MSTDDSLRPDPAQLPDDVTLLKQLVTQLYASVQERDRRVAQLEQHLHLLVKRFLHPASEKLDPRQLVLFLGQGLDESTASAGNSAPAITAETPAAEQTARQKPRQKTPHGRRRPPEVLERQHVIHDLTPEQKLALGGAENLVSLGEDVTSQYEWTPSSVLVVEHHYLKYVRRESPTQPADSAAANSATIDGVEPASPATRAWPEWLLAPVISVPRVPSIIPGGAAGPGLLAQVIVSKYGDHLPLHRQERIFARQGVHFTRQTLCDWCAACAQALVPLTDLIRAEVLRSFVIHTDDTPVDVRDAQAKAQFQARFWTYLGDEQVRLTWFDFTTTRQRAGPDRVLAGYTGYLQADGYGGYDDYEGIALSEASPILKVACWAHARRKFHDALRTELMPAQIALARIGQLYALEKTLRQRAATEWRELSAEARAALGAAERKLVAQPLLDALKIWLEQQQETALPKSPIAVAVRYALNQWNALVRYVEDGRLAIDNNLAERALRGIAIGRKNWLFCGSEAGGRTAAVHFTLIASALRNGLDPWAYLRDVLTRLPTLGERPTRDDLLPLLPTRWQPSSASPTA